MARALTVIRLNVQDARHWRLARDNLMDNLQELRVGGYPHKPVATYKLSLQPMLNAADPPGAATAT